MSRIWWRIVFSLGALGLLWPGLLAGQDISVHGLGFFENLNMERRLEFLRGTATGSPESSLDLVQVEDTAYVTLQQLRSDGYPDPVVHGEIVLTDGSKLTSTWSIPFEGAFTNHELDSPIQAVRFDCRPGVRNFYRSVEVSGIDVIDPGEVDNFFKPQGVLYTRKKDLVFTESNLSTRLAHLLGSLQEQGFLRAKVTSRQVHIDPESGAVDVHLEIDQGVVYRVGNVQTLRFVNGQQVDSSTRETFEGDIYNDDWLRARRQEILNKSNKNGYPDTRIEVRESDRRDEANDRVLVDVTLVARQGRRVNLVGIRFQPRDLIRESVLHRTVALEESGNFDLLALEGGRRSLLGLGILSDVDLEQRVIRQGHRLVTYHLTPMPRQELTLRAGWGSYERMRVGLRWQQRNLWKRAHRYEFDLRTSTKSFNADLLYVMPHFFDKRTTAYVKTGHEFREEITYDRTTTSILAGATRRLRWPGMEVSLEYSLERQNARRESVESFDTSDEITVAGLTAEFTLDRRDSSLYPTGGYDFSIRSKTADAALGGEANFEKLELGATYHRYLGKALYLHLSLRYGTILSGSPTADNLPFTERFFLGGDTTLRGYNRGEAAPLDAEGLAIGAESFALANIEIEQRVLSSLSVVLFWDGLVQNTLQDTFPDEESLSSIGIGLRLRTPVGPVRLEYGYNLDPRPTDPAGTLHLSVGYPF